MSDLFPCHPEYALAASRRSWARCPACGSLVRSRGMRCEAYGGDYPAARGHHDPEVGRCKVQTLERWLERLGLNVAGQTVCEIGFGGAACLAALQERGATVLGLEPVAANRVHAEELGIPRAHLFDSEPLPRLPRKPTLWLLQDSFEHIPDPNSLVRWMAAESAATGARALVVAPDAGSPSRALMGRFWIHNVPDHQVHYSRAGVASIFSRAGFRVLQAFYPLKRVSLAMVWRHLRLLAGAPTPVRSSDRASPSIWFNIGEMGLLLERDDRRR